MAKYLYLDTETGGLSAAKDALLTVGLVAHDDELGILDTTHIQVLPEGRIVGGKALEVNKINMNAHNIQAMSRLDAARAVVAFVRKNFGTGFNDMPLMIGHNVKFDVGFMDALWESTGVKQPYHYHAMCTMGIAQVCKQLGVLETANLKLDTLVKKFNIEFGAEGAHNSLADALATRLVHIELVNLLRPGAKAA